ncbi:MAG: lytic polysaccharide monooxygenase [Burkholderiales bacterium]|nr:lytic polysaccharide monooxygenase [Burkholderiales bacterium]
MKKIIFTSLILAITSQVFAHGWQTYPVSRTEYQRKIGQGPVSWEPQSIASTLSGAGGQSYDAINGYTGGSLGFFKKHHAAQSDNICTQNGSWPTLATPLPEKYMTEISYGKSIPFKWQYTAWHTPSNMFVFTTKYKANQYNANPTWNDLTFLCSDPISTQKDPRSWSCTYPDSDKSLNEKQILVTVWQRKDPAGENFISCSDVKIKDSTPVTPENIWTPIEKDPQPWISNITPLENELVTFELDQNKNGVTSNLATYSLSVTAKNLANWDQILATKINNDTTFTQVIGVGELNAKQGSVIYNDTVHSKNFVYLNNTVAELNVTYSYKISKKKDTNPVVQAWSRVGCELAKWLHHHNKIKKGDKLSFSLDVSGKEETVGLITVDDIANAEKDIARAVNKYTFANHLKVRVGVLNGTTVEPEDSGNYLYIYKDANDETLYSYVVRVVE